MKIAFFHNIPSGGAKRSAYEHIKGLSEKHNIDLYTIKGIDGRFLPLTNFVKATFEFKENFLPETFFFLNPILCFLNLYYSEMLARKIAQRINSGDYDIAYLTHCLPTPAPSILRYLRIPSIYYCQEPPREFYEPQLLSKINHYFSIRKKLQKIVSLPYKNIYKNIDRRNIKFAKKVLTNSFYSKKRIKEIYGIEAEVIYHGVDTDKFKPKTINKENTVISVGALHWRKGHRFIIECLALLKNKPKLVIASDREDKNERGCLLNLAKLRNIEIEIYQNITPDEKLIELYNKAKLCVCAQYSEPFGLITLEAMSSGIPVVAVKEGGFVETIVNGETGILIERDLNEFSQAVSKLLENENLRKIYGEKAREYVIKNWSWDVSVEKLERVLLSC